MTADATNDVDYPAALADLLNYCRDARRSLSAGRTLGPILLKDAVPHPGASGTLNYDWALARQMKLLLAQQLEHCRKLVGLAAPVSSSPIEHGPALKADMQQNRQDLKLWSLLWAYYICAMSHDEMTRLCGWSRRNNEVLLKQGRDAYLLQKVVELGTHLPSSALAHPQVVEPVDDAEQPTPSANPDDQALSPQSGKQEIVNNSGVAVIGNVTRGTIQQFN